MSDKISQQQYYDALARIPNQQLYGGALRIIETYVMDLIDDKKYLEDRLFACEEQINELYKTIDQLKEKTKTVVLGHKTART